MDENGKPLEKHAVVGRRIRDDQHQPSVELREGSVRLLLNAFLEDRVGANISMDHFWTQTLSQRNEAKRVGELEAICQREHFFPLIGWACARVDEFTKCDGIASAVLTPKPDSNPYHADLVKRDWLVVTESDTSQNKREKARILAHQLTDVFNDLLQAGKSSLRRPTSETPGDSN